MKNRKKWIAIAIAVFVIIAAGIIIRFNMANNTLEQKIIEFLDGNNDYVVISIERFESGKDPMIIDVVNESDKDSVIKELKNTKISYSKSEIGMKTTSVLYTFDVVAGDDHLSVTVNDNNDIHFNHNETTYQSDGSTTLYQTLDTVFSINIE